MQGICNILNHLKDADVV